LTEWDSEPLGDIVHKIIHTIYAISAGAVVGLAVIVGLVIGLVGSFEWLVKRFGFMILALALLSPLALGQLAQQGQEQVVTYSGATAFVLSNTPVNPNLLTATGTNTFIMNVNPPTNSARIYITNDTANACSNLTISIASTGNSSLNSFNQNLAAWQSVFLSTLGNAPAASVPITLPASGTLALTSQPIIGSKIAVFVVLSSACATTSIDLQVVFGTFTPATGTVTGINAPGVASTTVPPLLIGGISSSGQAQLYGACAQSGLGCAGSTGFALPVGANGNSITQTSASVTTMNSRGDPLLTLASVLDATATNVSATPSVGAGVTNNNTTGNQRGLMVSSTGFYKVDNASIVGSGVCATCTRLLNSPPGAPSVSSCYVSLNLTLVSGTTPTAQAFLQTSGDGVTWTDRIAFNQASTTSNFYAGIASNGGIAPASAQSLTLAAGTKIDGPIPVWIRMLFNLGGTTPSWTEQTGISCQ
jgi:hypothetical protein